MANSATLSTLPRLEDLVFVGFNRRVVALDRYRGEIRWQWKAPHGGGLPTILVDGDRLIVSCMGYTWCLDPVTGAMVWYQPLSGLGTGIACVASVRGSSQVAPAAAQLAAAAAAAAAAAS